MLLPPNASVLIHKKREMQKMMNFTHVIHFQRRLPPAYPRRPTVTCNMPSCPPWLVGHSMVFFFRWGITPDPLFAPSSAMISRKSLQTEPVRGARGNPITATR